MTKTIIHIDGALPLAVLDEKGWVQGAWSTDGGVCAHQAIRLCAPQPGDAYLVERVADVQGWGTGWNDAQGRTEAEVRARLGAGVDVTDADLLAVFGPNWLAVVDVVRRSAVTTADEASRLGAAWVAARDAARDADRDAAWSAARGAAWSAAVWDLASADGPFTHAHRDLLIGPWESVFGLPEGLTR